VAAEVPWKSVTWSKVRAIQHDPTFCDFLWLLDFPLDIGGAVNEQINSLGSYRLLNYQQWLGLGGMQRNHIVPTYSKYFRDFSVFQSADAWYTASWKHIAQSTV
jgi:hypothetical protein